ncbi:hypothetical protein SLA2020_178510 [Shorea laevis]
MILTCSSKHGGGRYFFWVVTGRLPAAPVYPSPTQFNLKVYRNISPVGPNTTCRSTAPPLIRPPTGPYPNNLLSIFRGSETYQKQLQVDPSVGGGSYHFFFEKTGLVKEHHGPWDLIRLTPTTSFAGVGWDPHVVTTRPPQLEVGQDGYRHESHDHSSDPLAQKWSLYVWGTFLCMVGSFQSCARLRSLCVPHPISFLSAYPRPTTTH